MCDRLKQRAKKLNSQLVQNEEASLTGNASLKVSIIPNKGIIKRKMSFFLFLIEPGLSVTTTAI